VALTIPHDDLTSGCAYDDPKLKRFLKTHGFTQTSTYLKRTADDIALKAGCRIEWYKYPEQKRDDSAAEPLRRGIASDLLSKIDQWYRQLTTSRTLHEGRSGRHNLKKDVVCGERHVEIKDDYFGAGAK
jgi:hypothetical protein